MEEKQLSPLDTVVVTLVLKCIIHQTAVRNRAEMLRQLAEL